MRRLSLLGARFRRIYGNEETRRPSRFLGELPDAVIGTIRGAPRAVAERPRAVMRGGDVIEYDVEDAPRSFGSRRTFDEDFPSPHRESGDLSYPPPESGPSPFRKGKRVHHNTFGEGVIEEVDGVGVRAYLTIRFGPETKRVSAKFVRLLDPS
jgi:hypothetical protein